MTVRTYKTKFLNYLLFIKNMTLWFVKLHLNLITILKGYSKIKLLLKSLKLDCLLYPLKFYICLNVGN